MRSPQYYFLLHFRGESYKIIAVATDSHHKIPILFRAFLRENSARLCFLHISQSELFQIKNELQYIDDNSDFSWEECAFLKYHAVWKLLYWFSHALYRQNTSINRTADNTYELHIINALEYIHNHYSEKVTIDVLCKEVFLSRSTFLRNFKAVCGASPIEYLNHYRCKKALEQLEDVNRSKTEIAHACGFYDLSHMERILKKYR